MTEKTEFVLSARDETQAAFTAVNGSLSKITGTGINLAQSFKGIGQAALGLSGVASLAAFKGQIDSAIHSMAELKAASEKTGASVENLSALKGIAKIGDRDFGAIEGALGKLNKALHGTDDESKGAGKALAALGLNIKDLRDMDPAQAFIAIARAQEKFADGGGKSAALMAIMGKTAAEQIPYMHDLADAHSLIGKATTQAAKDADDYEKNVKRLTASYGALSRQMAAAVVGPMKDVTDWMLKAQKDGGVLMGVLTGIGMAALAAAGVKINPLERAESQANEAFTKVINLKQAIAATEKAVDSGDGGLLGQFINKKKLASFKDDLAEAEKDLKSSTRRLKKLATQQVEDDKPKDTSLNSQSFGAAPKEAKANDPHANDYSNLISSLNEKIAVQTADLQSVEKLTQAEKDYAKFQADLASGATVLSASQKNVAESFFEVYRARNKANEADKANKTADIIVGDYARGNALIVERIDREAELALMTDRQRGIAQALYKAEDDGAAIRARIIHDVQDETAQKVALTKAEEELANQKVKVADATAAAYDEQKSFEFGWTKAFQSYSDNANNSAKSAQAIFEKSTGAMEDSIVQFAMTGKASFSGLTNSIIADLIRIEARTEMTKAMSAVGGSNGGAGLLGGLFGSWFGGSSANVGAGATVANSSVASSAPVADSFAGVTQTMLFANGGIMSKDGSLPLHKYAFGGIANSPQLAMFGEGRLPEAYVPLPDGRRIPVNIKVSGGVVSAPHLPMYRQDRLPDVEVPQPAAPRIPAQTQGGSASRMVSVVNHFAISAPTDPRTQQQIATMAAMSVQRAMARNG